MTTFLDWVTAGPFGASAWDGNGSFRLAEWLGIDALDALLVVVAALAGLAFIVAPLLGKTLRPVPFAVAGAGAGLLFIGVLNIWYITSEGGEGVSVGLGVYALIAAGGTAAVCGYIDERPPASRRPT